MFVNLNLVAVAMPCMESFTFYHEMTLQLVAPIAVVVFTTSACYLGGICCLLDDWQSSAIDIFLKVIFLCYPGCSAAALKPFVPSSEIEGKRYLVADYRLEYEALLP